MPDIIISGEIGWEVEANEVRDQFAKVDPDADIEIDLSSSGGSVFQGVQIGHMIRDHKGKTTVTISAAALSMGSHISANADVVKVHDDTAYMAHNPWMMTVGDYLELESDAKLLKSLAGMLSNAYAKKSGQEKPAIRTLMDSTTWLFGQEIVDAGFADELIETENPEDKENAIAFAKLQFAECMDNLKTFAGAADDYKKIAALLPADPQKPAKTPVKPQPKQGKTMNEEQFLAFLESNPEAKAFYADGMAYIKAVADQSTPPDLSAMSLTDILALAPVAKTEHETALTAARTEVETGKLTAEQIKKVFAIAKSPEYAALGAVGEKVLTGERDFSSFEDMITMADQQTATLKAQGLIKDQPAETPAGGVDAGDDTNVKSPKIQASIKNFKSLIGVE